LKNKEVCSILFLGVKNITFFKMDSTTKKLLIGLIISILILAGSIFYRLNCADDSSFMEEQIENTN
jgi:hypothetical protein